MIISDVLPIAETTSEGFLLPPVIALPPEVQFSEQIREFDDDERDVTDHFPDHSV
ncbi:MAG: hypothetical protein V3S41_06330 [Spirochaetia bacterium]